MLKYNWELCQIWIDLKKSNDRLSSKPFLIWLLTTPPHFQYVATLPCNLSSVARFADINVSQGSVATYLEDFCVGSGSEDRYSDDGRPTPVQFSKQLAVGLYVLCNYSPSHISREPGGILSTPRRHVASDVSRNTIARSRLTQLTITVCSRFDV